MIDTSDKITKTDKVGNFEKNGVNISTNVPSNEGVLTEKNNIYPSGRDRIAAHDLFSMFTANIIKVHSQFVR